MTTVSTTLEFVYSPNNFPLNHRELSLHDLVYLRIRQSDTVNERGIALVLVEEVFGGWVVHQGLGTIYTRVQGGEIHDLSQAKVNAGPRHFGISAFCLRFPHQAIYRRTALTGITDIEWPQWQKESA